MQYVGITKQTITEVSNQNQDVTQIIEKGITNGIFHIRDIRRSSIDNSV